MSWILRFFRQPCGAYRNFQIVFTLLTLNFVIPAISYALAPQIAADQFRQINALLGGSSYDFPEAASRLWRYLGAANVMTLGLMCFLLQWDLRKYRVILLPLFFLKSYNATLYLFGYFGAPQYPAFLAVAIFDYITSWAFWFFSTRAHRAIQEVEDEQLIPRPASSRG